MPSATRRSGGAALPTPPGSAERYLLFGLDQLAERGWTTHHNLERAATPARLGARGRRGTEVGARAGRRLRRRLRDGARVAPAREPRGRRLLDRRHGRHPADASRTGRDACARRSSTSRSGSPSGSRGCAPTACGGCTRARSPRARPCSHTASTRRTSFGDWLASLGESTRRRVRSVRRRRARVRAVESSRQPSTSSRSARTRTATSSSCSRSRRSCRSARSES